MIKNQAQETPLNETIHPLSPAPHSTIYTKTEKRKYILQTYKKKKYSPQWISPGPQATSAHFFLHFTIFDEPSGNECNMYTCIFFSFYNIL